MSAWWTFDSEDQSGGKIGFDLTKDFGEGYSAGLKIELDPDGKTSAVNGGYLTDPLAQPTVTLNNHIVAYDLWIKMAKDFGTITFQTDDVGLLKGEYTDDALTIGAGYQAHTPTGITNSIEDDTMAVWAGYKIGESINLGIEYASRPNVDGVDADLNIVTGSTAILVKAGYTADALTINGQVLMTTGSFCLIDPDDMSATSPGISLNMV